MSFSEEKEKTQNEMRAFEVIQTGYIVSRVTNLLSGFREESGVGENQTCDLNQNASVDHPFFGL